MKALIFLGAELEITTRRGSGHVQEWVVKDDNVTTTPVRLVLPSTIYLWIQTSIPDHGQVSSTPRETTVPPVPWKWFSIPFYSIKWSSRRSRESLRR